MNSLGLSLQLGGLLGPSVPALPAGATARWDASVLSGSDGDLVSTLSDTIGTNHATAAGSARGTLKTGANGLNGRNVLRLNGVANVYTLTSSLASSGDWTVLAVMKRNGTEAIGLGNTLDYFPSVMRNNTSVLAGNGRSATSGGYASASNSQTGWEIVTAAWSSTAAVRGRSNASTLSFGSTTVYGVSASWNAIGRRGINYGNCDIAEVIYWPSVLTAQQIADAHANLNAKWIAY